MSEIEVWGRSRSRSRRGLTSEAIARALRQAEGLACAKKGESGSAVSKGELGPG